MAEWSAVPRSFQVVKVGWKGCKGQGRSRCQQDGDQHRHQGKEVHEMISQRRKDRTEATVEDNGVKESKRGRGKE